ncbi:MAG: tRNA epoxyqueuosine(34) reductase QueG [Flavobacteriales bacterium]|nr:tRNA epoxyqueuosine(34) reductase QueG [Flavobacteriales bacterium]
MEAFDLKLQARSEWVKSTARAMGFLDCRIAKAARLEQEEAFLEKWLRDQKHGGMDYMSKHFDLRVDPRKLVPGAKSVIVLSMNYFPEEALSDQGPKLSKYAYGRDYHKVIKKRLKEFLFRMEEQFGEVQGRGFVDSAPVMEKAWATRAGIGWMGKHTNVLSKQKGSFYFLAVLITDLELASDGPVTDHCGSCTACIDACPTDAIVAPYVLDGSKCISYFTIELKDADLPTEFAGKFNDWMFGCDICQDVCPWNRFSQPHQTEEFLPKQALQEMDRKDWERLEEEEFDVLFEGSAVKRTKYSGLMRNIRFLNLSDRKPD